MNVPNVYEELEQRNPNQMSKIISAASIVIISSFFFAGVFGYATFMQDPGQLCSENVLQASGYSNQNMIQMGSIALVFCVASGFPICMIPCKNSIEELFFKGRIYFHKINNKMHCKLKVHRILKKFHKACSHKK